MAKPEELANKEAQAAWDRGLPGFVYLCRGAGFDKDNVRSFSLQLSFCLNVGWRLHSTTQHFNFPAFVFLRPEMKSADL